MILKKKKKRSILLTTFSSSALSLGPYLQGLMVRNNFSSVRRLLGHHSMSDYRWKKKSIHFSRRFPFEGMCLYTKYTKFQLSGLPSYR